MAESLKKEITKTLDFIESCGFHKKARAWKKTDLLTLIVELHYLLVVKKLDLDPKLVRIKLSEFYSQVNAAFALDDSGESGAGSDPRIAKYLKAATKATNDKYARVDRAAVIEPILRGCTRAKPSKQNSKLK